LDLSYGWIPNRPFQPSLRHSAIFFLTGLAGVLAVAHTLLCDGARVGSTNEAIDSEVTEADLALRAIREHYAAQGETNLFEYLKFIGGGLFLVLLACYFVYTKNVVWSTTFENTEIQAKSTTRFNNKWLIYTDDAGETQEINVDPATYEECKVGDMMAKPAGTFEVQCESRKP
jgi:hypothetical protein